MLQTDRLHLIPFSEGEAKLLHQIFTDPHVREYLWDNEVISPEAASEILQVHLMLFEKKRWGLWRIVSLADKTTMGFVGLWYFFEEPLPQLIYGLLPPFVGQGFATEAAGRIISYAFQELNFPHIVAAMDAPHLASQAVAKRLSMSKVEEKEIDGRLTVFFRIDHPGAIVENYSK